MAVLSASLIPWLGAHGSGPEAHSVVLEVLKFLVHAVSEDGLATASRLVVPASTLHLAHHHFANLNFFFHLKSDCGFDFLPHVLSLSGFVCLLDLPLFECNSRTHLHVFLPLLQVLFL